MERKRAKIMSSYDDFFVMICRESTENLLLMKRMIVLCIDLHKRLSRQKRNQKTIVLRELLGKLATSKESKQE